MDSTVPPSRLLLVPKGNMVEVPKNEEVLFEKASYTSMSKQNMCGDTDFAVISMACIGEEQTQKPESFNTYVKKCGDLLKREQNTTEYIMVCGGGCFLQTRAAIVAAREYVHDKMIFVLLQMDENGGTADGWDLLGQVITLEGMDGVGIIIDCATSAHTQEVVEQVLPYVGTMPVGVWIADESYATKSVVDSVDIIICKQCVTDNFVEHIKNLGFFENTCVKPQKRDDIIAVTNGYPTIVQTYVDISDAVVCDDDFDENILISEDDAWAVTKVDITDEDSLDIFEIEQYMLKEPLCIYSEDVEIFARAVRMFCGRAIYDGTCDISDDVLADLHKKYGLIIL